MELLKKFEKGAVSHTYQRIDSSYKVKVNPFVKTLFTKN